MKPRMKRTIRRSGVRVELGPRDEALLRALARFRLARSADLGRLFFAGRHRDVCASRLRRLYDAGFLETHAADLAAPNLYSLGPRGKSWIRDAGGTVHPLPRPPVEHHLGVINVWTRLAAVAYAVPGARLVRFVPEFEVRESQLGVVAGVVPDALVELAATTVGRTQSARLAVELDRATESLAVLHRKLAALDAAVSGDGLPGWPDCELVVALDEAGARREGAIRALVSECWPGTARVWTLATDLAAEVRALTGPPKAPVTHSRCGDGREAHASPDAAVSSSVTGGGLSDE